MNRLRIGYRATLPQDGSKGSCFPGSFSHQVLHLNNSDYVICQYRQPLRRAEERLE